MTDETRALFAEGEALRSEITDLLLEIDATLEAWGHSIEEGLQAAHQLRDACAALEEWL